MDIRFLSAFRDTCNHMCRAYWTCDVAKESRGRREASLTRNCVMVNLATQTMSNQVCPLGRQDCVVVKGGLAVAERDAANRGEHVRESTATLDQ